MNSKKSLVLTFATLAIVCAGSISASASTLTVGPAVGSCTGTYPTISAAVAVANPGDTITVCPGTYHELVTVNKPLTLLGAQATVDARSGSRTGLPSTESVVDGLAGSTSFYVTANNVTIDGFTVQGATNANVFGYGIVLGAGTSGSHVVNNIIQNNIVGLALANAAGGNQALIQQNLFRNNTQTGPASGHGIYTDNFVSGGVLTNVLIDSNDFVVNNGASDTWGIGIGNFDSGNPYTNLTIQNNRMTSSSPFSRGMYFYGTHTSTVVGNLISNKTNYAIGLFGDDTGITVHCNTLTSNGRGVWVGNDLPGNSNFAINDNNIAGNTIAGLEVDTVSYSGGAGSLNAERNWWGSSTGPTIASNSGGSGDTIIDPDGVVDYTPFRTAPVPDVDNDGILDPCDSFVAVGPPTNKDQCKNDGWKSFNTPRTFKNQGDCVSYMSNGK